ncbi:MAG: NADP-dependent isocitrate dehydrogenase [Clostridia bacterium]|nr:NADP-dependent isocitrate dehydrogenase [Clostridia bacterium]
MTKIGMLTPLVEMDGDEMTRVCWAMIKDILIKPYVDLKTEYFDLGLAERDRTNDEVTYAAAKRTHELGVAVKCATITPNAQRVEEFGLKKMWPSPNATIRAALDGTVFRAPVLISNIKPFVKSWKKPITVARHAYGDVYKATEMQVGEAGTAVLEFHGNDGEEQSAQIFDFKGPGILQAQYNTEESIINFAKSCFNYALTTGQDLWFSTKDTISKKYDHRFKDIFAELYQTEFSDAFKEAGISYFYTLIDDAIARVVRSEGGFVWALKNYDGDVMSDFIAAASGSLAMMTSVLVSPTGQFEFEAAHGTVTRHYYRYLKGEKTSTNPIATIFAWTGALKQRGNFDQLPKLVKFAEDLERACLAVLESGSMTKDLAGLVENMAVKEVDTESYLFEVAEEMHRQGYTAE